MPYISRRFNGVSSDLIRLLETYESDTDRPVRVLDGRWAIKTSPEWQIGQSGEHTVEEGQERGITIIACGMLSTAQHSGNAGFPWAWSNTPDRDDGNFMYDPSQHMMAEPQEHSGTLHIDVGGHIVGELVERTIWLRFGLSYTNEAHFDWDRVLAPALGVCTDPEVLESLAREQTELGVRRAEAYFANIPRRRTEAIRNDIAAVEESIAGHRDVLAANHRSLMGHRDRLDSVLAMAASLQGLVTREWELIQNHPRIMLADFSSEDTLRLVTDDIVMAYPNIPGDERTGTTRWLGPFEIQINLETYTVTMHNQHTRMNGRDHPHVRSGRPCFGASETAVSTLLGEGQLYAFVELCFQYLSTFNPRDDYGRYAAYWFEREDRAPGDEAEVEATEEITPTTVTDTPFAEVAPTGMFTIPTEATNE